MYFIQLILLTHTAAEITCEEERENTTVAPALEATPTKDEQCPPWFFYNATTTQCECYSDPRLDGIIRCTSQTALLRFGFCTTFERDQGFFVARCNYFNPKVYDTTDDNYIILPQNRSELNGYMCDPLNREGRVCSQCMDGFGPAVFSTVPTCSNCKDAWYGIPVYLFLEFVPITIFYFIVVIFRINVTSAPMLAFVIFSQVTVGTLQSQTNNVLLNSTPAFYYITIVSTFYGIWNLDFLRFNVFPPFCVSPNIKPVHITYLACVSAIYPICLTVLIWIAITLHSKNNKLLVWSWNKLNKHFLKYITFVKDEEFGHNTMIDVIATFVLLSYAKLLFVSNRIFSYTTSYNLNVTTLTTNRLYQFDPSIEYFGREHIPFALLSAGLFLTTIVPITLLLSLYPIKKFRSLLYNTVPSKRLMVSINIFADKFFSSYKNDVDRKKDKRGFIGLYFILRIVVLFLQQDRIIFIAVIYVCGGMVVALARPYRRAYMNIIDPLIIFNIGIITVFVNKLSEEDNQSFLIIIYQTCAGILVVLPLLGLIIVILYKLIDKERKNHYFYKMIRKCLRNTSAAEAAADTEDVNRDDNSIELPDRIVHPEQYVHGLH